MTVNIKEIFAQNIRFGIEYCRICFRTSKETHLIRPVFGIRFAKLLKNNIFDFQYYSKRRVCNMCEANAKIAVRMFNAYDNAAKGQLLLQTIEENIDNPDASLPASVVHSMRYVNNQLAELRDETTYKFTKVLCVDSNQVHWAQSSLNTGNEAPLPPPPVIVETRIESPQLPPWQPNLETVVIDDDDDDETPTQTKENAAPINNHIVVRPELPKLVSLKVFLSKPADNQAAIMSTENKLIVRNFAASSHCFLHNIVYQRFGKVYVPSLGSEIMKNKLHYTDNMPIFLKSIPTVPILIENLKETLLKDELTSKNDKLMNNGHPFNGIKIVNVETQSEVEFVNESKADGKSDEVNTILENALSKMNNKRTAQKERVDNKKMCKFVHSDSAPLAVISEVKSEKELGSCVSDSDETLSAVSTRDGSPVDRSQPTVNADRVDWEDKIPMDVISFVEPNENMLIQPYKNHTRSMSSTPRVILK